MKDLVTLVEDSGLVGTKSQFLMDQFSIFFEKASEFETKARQISVTDASQKQEMSEAREMRLEIRDIRIKTEKKRKELKEQSLREGKAIDGIANIIKATVIPIEEHLEKQEKFVENLEEEKKEKVTAERTSQISQYMEDLSSLNLKDMTDEAFEAFLETVRIAHEYKRDTVKKVEEERLAKEKVEAEERERIRLENERLKKEADVREKKMQIERKKAEAEREKIEEEKMRLRAKITARENAERKEREDVKRKEREARLAPDKDKLITFADSISAVRGPRDLSEESQNIVNKTEKLLFEISQNIKNKARNL